jgi:hypothetical protein
MQLIGKEPWGAIATKPQLISLMTRQWLSDILCITPEQRDGIPCHTLHSIIPRGAHVFS